MTAIAMMTTVMLGYLIGSLPLGFLIARGWSGVDLRAVGSGNVGATNTLRSAGWKLGLVVMALDVAKGASAVLLALRVGATESIAVAAGVAAIVGHIFPVWLRGQGGKGVATTGGVFVVLAPAATAVAALAFVAGTAASRVVSVGSLLATLALPSAAAAGGAPRTVTLGAVAAASLIVWRHRENLRRLRAGTERRLTEATPGGPGA